MDSKEKRVARHKLGLCILQRIEDSKHSGQKNSIKSLRGLAAASGVEYSIIQRITSGQKDPQFTTLVAISEGFGIDVSILLSGINEITDQSLHKRLIESEKKTKKAKSRK